MKIEVLGREGLLTGENSKDNICFFKLIPDVKKKKQTISHHILLADVSGSMYYQLKTLKEKIATTLKALLEIPDSYVSIITYSGHNESKRILNSVKCDEISYNMSKVYETIEKELHTKSVTVISEPLEDSIEICKELNGVCNKHHIALFTDGCLVPWNWSETIEENKCYKVAEICNNTGIFLNAIGFGQYYDRKFLNKLIDVAGNGQVIHIDSVSDYFEVIIKAIQRVNNEDVETVNMKVINGSIFNVNTSMLNYEHNVSLNENNVFGVYEDESIIIDEVVYKLNNVENKDKILSQDVKDDFYYSLARYYLKEENIDDYEFIVKYLGDINLFNETENCYSFLEKGNSIRKVTECLEDVNKRFLSGRQQIIETASNQPLCLLEVLQMIMDDEDSKLYFDLDTPYHRITQASKSIEDSISFTRTSKGLVPVTSISVGSEKLNIGIKVKIDGIVKDDISGYEKEACIFRDYNLLNGGNVNVPYIHAKLSQNLFNAFMDDTLIECGGTFTDLHISTDSYGNILFKINLNNIKSVNKRILKSMSMTDITETLYDIACLKCEQHAYNKFIKQLLGEKTKIDMMNLSFEEQEMRKLLRIDENGIYQPLKVEKDETAKFEIYPAIYMTWGIAQFPDKKKKEECFTDIVDFFRNVGLNVKNNQEEMYRICSEYLNSIKSKIKEKEFRVNCVRIAAAMMNKSPFIWDVELEKAKTTNDKVLNRNMVIGGKINVSKKNVYDVVIEQKRWSQLIKCN
jgi:hypothetical protein